MTLLTPSLLETKTYAFSRVRRALEHTGLQEGVIGATDLQVSQRAAGANMSVDVAAGGAWVRGDDTARQGAYHAENDATVNVSVGAAHATLPRIDQVVLRIYDSTVTGGGLDQASIEVLAGAPTSGATLDNRTGAATPPATAIRLADILVPGASSTVTTGNIRDRRPWSRGAHYTIAATADYGIQSPSPLTTYRTARIECSGGPVEVEFHAIVEAGTFGGGGTATLSVALGIDNPQNYLALGEYPFVSGGGRFPVALRRVWTPTAGSHVFTMAAFATQPATVKAVTPGLAGSGVDLFRVRENLASLTYNG